MLQGKKRSKEAEAREFTFGLNVVIHLLLELRDTEEWPRINPEGSQGVPGLRSARASSSGIIANGSVCCLRF